jgi:hypothetical protein
MVIVHDTYEVNETFFPLIFNQYIMEECSHDLCLVNLTRHQENHSSALLYICDSFHTDGDSIISL